MSWQLVVKLDRLFLEVLKTGALKVNDGTDPRDAIIAELQAQVEYMTGAAQQIADATDLLMDEQDRLHAVELETQELKLRAEALERENAFKLEVNGVYSSFIDTQATVLQALHRKKAVIRHGIRTPHMG